MLRYFLVVLAVVALLILLFWPAGRARFRQVPVGKLQPHLDFLLRFARTGSFTVFQDPHSSRFVQFRKESDGSGGGFLVLDFPDAPWSRCHFEHVARALQQRGIPFAMVATEALEVPRFLEVKGIRTVEEAQAIAQLVFQQLGLDENATVEVCLEVTGVERVKGQKKGDSSFRSTS